MLTKVIKREHELQNSARTSFQFKILQGKSKHEKSQEGVSKINVGGNYTHNLGQQLSCKGVFNNKFKLNGGHEWKR